MAVIAQGVYGGVSGKLGNTVAYASAEKYSSELLMLSGCF